jgi:hypothetical protein
MLFCLFLLIYSENSLCLIADKAEKVKFQFACFNFTRSNGYKAIFEFGSIMVAFDARIQIRDIFMFWNSLATHTHTHTHAHTYILCLLIIISLGCGGTYNWTCSSNGEHVEGCSFLYPYY